MPVLVSDTSVLIDLERAALLEVTFGLPHTLVVPDFLYERELREYGGPALIDLGLRVEGLTPEGVEQAGDLRRQFRSLSISDSFALVLAENMGCALLTGDKALRSCAEGRGRECHGLLWVFDELEHHGVCDRDKLKNGLEVLAVSGKCRLPSGEITVRLARYG